MLTIADQFKSLLRERAKQPKPVPVGSHDERMASVLMLLDQRNWTIADLIERMNVSKSSVWKALNQLGKEGRIIQFTIKDVAWYSLSNLELKKMKEQKQCNFTDATAMNNRVQEAVQ